MPYYLIDYISTINTHVTTTLFPKHRQKKVYIFPSPEKCHPCDTDTQIPHEKEGCDCQSFVEIPWLYTLNYEWGL